MSEQARKAAYRYVAELLEREAHPPDLQLEVQRIQRAMAIAGGEVPGRQPELHAFDQLVAKTTEGA